MRSPILLFPAKRANRAMLTSTMRLAFETTMERCRTNGSVRARASKYNLCSQTCGDVPLRGFQDGQHRHATAEELESAAIGGEVLWGGGAGEGGVAPLILRPAATGRGSRAFYTP